MKKYWKLSRGKRTALNLLLAALVLTLLWGMWGYPLPTAELEFRRMEGENLLPKSEIVFNSKKEDPLQWRDLPDLYFSWCELVIGVETDQVHVADLRNNSMAVWPLEEGITPVPLYNISIIAQWPGRTHSGTALLFLNVPAETEKAEIRIDAENLIDGGCRYEGEGWRIAPGRWIFAVYPGDSYSGSWYAGGGYTLTLYRADGSFLAEQRGSFPK